MNYESAFVTALAVLIFGTILIAIVRSAVLDRWPTPSTQSRIANALMVAIPSVTAVAVAVLWVLYAIN